MKSAIYVGSVQHRRYAPVVNQFRYRLFMVFVDLDELPGAFNRHPLWSVERPNLVSFRRSDYLGAPDISLDAAVRDLIDQRTGNRPEGPIRLLTHFRSWGYCFNPVSIYYCYDASGQALETIVADINNTPWGERHAYVLSSQSNIHPSAQWRRFLLSKAFHISPFMGMNLGYDWRFRVPEEHISVHMRLLKDDHRIFDASLRLQRRPLSRDALTGVLLQYPFMTYKVPLMIYWQALRLWCKKAPFFPHPAKHPPT